ncbi:hypothetical protein RRG08_040070 [Elysia crispata]|uniref:Uncharacterized protein n=1 Tax=Elysia crispata TaxID=231223 RepID=A0AAE1CN04_9GAST|nr:hypothetical protein RRG08_040070 [Elysia crispata]
MEKCVKRGRGRKKGEGVRDSVELKSCGYREDVDNVKKYCGYGICLQYTHLVNKIISTGRVKSVADAPGRQIETLRGPEAIPPWACPELSCARFVCPAQSGEGGGEAVAPSGFCESGIGN